MTYTTNILSPNELCRRVLVMNTQNALSQAKAIHRDVDITTSAGLKQTSYIDVMSALHHHDSREVISYNMWDLIKTKVGTPDICIGIETGGAVLASLLANRFHCGYAYVRKSPKNHGLKRIMEGCHIKTISSKARVVLIDDVFNTNKTSNKAMKTLLSYKIDPIGYFSVFDYNPRPTGYQEKDYGYSFSLLYAEDINV